MRPQRLQQQPTSFQRKRMALLSNDHIKAITVRKSLRDLETISSDPSHILCGSSAMTILGFLLHAEVRKKCKSGWRTEVLERGFNTLPYSDQLEGYAKVKYIKP